MNKGNTNKIIWNLLCTFVCIIIASIGMSMTLKANVGVGSINSLTSTLSFITNIKVGTVLMGVNILCVLIQYAMQRSDFHWRQWLQLGVSFVLGEVVNITYYVLFKDIVISHYIVGFLLFLVGVSISCMAIAMIIRLNLVVFPVEAMSNVIAKKKGYQFKTVRQSIDGIAIMLSVIFTLIFQTEWTIREGSVLNFLILAPLSQYFLHFFERHNVLTKLIIVD